MAMIEFASYIKTCLPKRLTMSTYIEVAEDAIAAPIPTKNISIFASTFLIMYPIRVEVTAIKRFMNFELGLTIQLF